MVRSVDFSPHELAHSTQRTSQTKPALRSGRQRKRLANDGLDNLAATKALHADTASHYRPVFLELQPLQVRPEHAARNPRRLATVSTQILRLAAPSHLVPAHRLLTANFALHSH